jgi:hypothetical protein
MLIAVESGILRDLMRPWDITHCGAGRSVSNWRDLQKALRAILAPTAFDLISSQATHAQDCGAKSNRSNRRVCNLIEPDLH